jgi:hypothetical protein
MRPARAALLALLCTLTLGGCPEDEPLLTHGFVQLEFQRGESQPMNPYLGTVQVLATMEYEECLTAFYAANPGLQQGGPDGEAIFGGRDLDGEGWKDRLCEPHVDTQAECEVIEIDQKLDLVKQMTITYQIKEPSGNIEGLRLLFGPIPTDATADCAMGRPIVRVGANGAVKGKDGAGNDLWVTESFTPPDAVTNQGGPIRIAGAVK